MKKIYLDYAATTPVDPLVLKAMLPYFKEKFGNPGSLHSYGQEAIAAVDDSREKIARSIGAEFREIIFTGSATEVNNLALRGIVEGFNNTYNLTPRIFVSSIEHESILETCRDMERDGVEIIYLPVDKFGVVNLKKLEESLNERTILVSIMYANNEIGAIQPIAEISKIINEFKKEKKNPSPKPSQPSKHGPSLLIPRSGTPTVARRGQASESLDERSGLREGIFFSGYPLFHTDAVQAFQFLNCNVNDLGVDLMTLSAHKIYGPKGIGVLYTSNLKPNTYNLKPIITGGGQEFGFRSGTENVALIAGFAKAMELANKNRQKESKRIFKLANYFWKELKKIYPKVKLNGPTNNKKLPNILNIQFPSQNADDLLMKLDLSGIAASSGSACSSRAMRPSYVLKATGLSDKSIKNSLRFSFGKFTAKSEIDLTLKILVKIFKS